MVGGGGRGGAGCRSAQYYVEIILVYSPYQGSVCVCIAQLCGCSVMQHVSAMQCKKMQSKEERNIKTERNRGQKSDHPSGLICSAERTAIMEFANAKRTTPTTHRPGAPPGGVWERTPAAVLPCWGRFPGQRGPSTPSECRLGAVGVCLPLVAEAKAGAKPLPAGTPWAEQGGAATHAALRRSHPHPRTPLRPSCRMGAALGSHFPFVALTAIFPGAAG